MKQFSKQSLNHGQITTQLNNITKVHSVARDRLYKRNNDIYKKFKRTNEQHLGEKYSSKLPKITEIKVY